MNQNFFKEHSPVLIRLAPLACQTIAIQIGRQQHPNFLDKYTPAGSRTSASAMRNNPFFRSLLLSSLCGDATRRSVLSQNMEIKRKMAFNLINFVLISFINLNKNKIFVSFANANKMVQNRRPKKLHSLKYVC